MGDEPTKKRVVIIGGGCAGMAAAWELAKQPGYDIHVYEKSPRLGGKGASTRGDDGRIYEHGLHVWMGWYENAFRMMRECYAVVEDEGLGAKWNLAHSRFDEAFMPEPNVGLVDPKFEDGKPVTWSVYFPPNEGEPGTPMTGADNPFTMASYMARLMQMAKALVLSEVGDMPGDTPGAPRPDARSRSDEILNLDIKTPPADSTAALLNRMAELSKATALTGAAALLQLVTILEVWLRQQNIGPRTPESTLAIVEAAVSQVRKLLRDLVGLDKRLRMKTEVIDIVLTIMIGLFTDRVMFRNDGLDSLNDFDYREWLRLHGATKTSLESRFIRAAYDFAFAYEDGELKKPKLAAGVALRGGLRMFFTYRGAAFWRMRSGMGDAIFAPLYVVLNEASARDDDGNPRVVAIKVSAEDKSQGKAKASLQSPVSFHFGYELDTAEFTHGGSSLGALNFKSTPAHKEPLKYGGWPHAETKRHEPGSFQPRLQRRDDSSQPLAENEFDFAIIATGIHEFDGVFASRTYPGGETRAGEPAHEDVWRRWKATTVKTKTIATKSAQVWLDQSLYQLGWRRGSGLFTCMGWETFDTYADMTHLLPAEAKYAGLVAGSAPSPSPMRSVAYFCNPLAESTILKGGKRDQKTADEAVELAIEQLVTDEMHPFWPNLFEDKELTLDGRKAAWNDRKAAGKALDYPRANIDGSERYTLSLPGSIATRVSPLDPGIDNMTVAGDWTSTGLDCGCVEAAVMSGKLAAAAISGKPDLDDIVGYDQP